MRARRIGVCSSVKSSLYETRAKCRENQRNRRFSFEKPLKQSTSIETIRTSRFCEETSRSARCFLESCFFLFRSKTDKSFTMFDVDVSHGGGKYSGKRLAFAGEGARSRFLSRCEIKRRFNEVIVAQARPSRKLLQSACLAFWAGHTQPFATA